MTTLENIDALIRRAERLIDSVGFDAHGNAGHGGHGGLLSDETLKAADLLRIEVHRLKRKQC